MVDFFWYLYGLRRSSEKGEEVETLAKSRDELSKFIKTLNHAEVNTESNMIKLEC